MELKGLLCPYNPPLCQLKDKVLRTRNDWLREIGTGVLQKVQYISLYAGVPDGICWDRGPVAQLYCTDLPYVDFTGYTVQEDKHEGE